MTAGLRKGQLGKIDRFKWSFKGGFVAEVGKAVRSLPAGMTGKNGTIAGNCCCRSILSFSCSCSCRNAAKVSGFMFTEA